MITKNKNMKTCTSPNKGKHDERTQPNTGQITYF